VVVDEEIPKAEQTPVQTEEVNWVPRSDVRVAGTPKREIQVEINARTQDSAVIDCSGATSGHRVVLSIIVNRYWNP